MATDQSSSEGEIDPILSNLFTNYFGYWRAWVDRGAISEPVVDDDLNTTFRLRTAVICFYIHEDVTDITVADAQGHPIGRNERIYDIDFKANIVVASATPELFEFLVRRTGTKAPAATLGVTDYNSKLVVVQAYKRYCDSGNVALDFHRQVHPFLYAVQELGKDVIRRFGGVPFTTALDGVDLRSSYIPPTPEAEEEPVATPLLGSSSPPVTEEPDGSNQPAPEGNDRYIALLEMADLVYVLISPRPVVDARRATAEKLRFQLASIDPDSPWLWQGQSYDDAFDIFMIMLESPNADASALMFWSGDDVGALNATLEMKSFHRFAKQALDGELFGVKKGEVLNVKSLMTCPPKIKPTGDTITDGAIGTALRTMRPWS